MAMSRTARILIAILLLAAAAFFWVNFYTQSRTAELPTPTDVTAADGPTEATTPEVADTDLDSSPSTAEAIGESDVEAAPVEGAVSDDEAIDAAESDAPTVPTDGDDVPTADAVATEPAQGDADGERAGAATVEADLAAGAEAPLVVAPTEGGPPTVVVDAPVVGREIVIADLPFLVTGPRPTDVEGAEVEAADDEIARGVTTPTRATVNPFSPVVVRTPPAPERAIPETASVVGEVAVPAGPTPAEIAAAEAAARASAPTPRAVTPGSPGDTSALRPLPTGSVLSSTPELLREPRVGSAAEEVDFTTVTTIAVPDAEPADLVPSESDPAQAEAPDEVEPLTGTSVQTEASGTPATADTAPPPLAAGATQLARFLRDQNYSFTGSVLGPVGIGVFRSDLDAGPLVVALGQTLPDTEIVLTDLRGQQAELRLGDSTQILTLDLRR